jgi:hypothetical protein
LQLLARIGPIYAFHQTFAPEFASYFDLSRVWDLWLLLLTFGAFAEEFVFRGLLLRKLMPRYGLHRGIFLTGIVWTAYHFRSDSYSALSVGGVFFHFGPQDSHMSGNELRPGVDDSPPEIHHSRWYRPHRVQHPCGGGNQLPNSLERRTPDTRMGGRRFSPLSLLASGSNRACGSDLSTSSSRICHLIFCVSRYNETSG